MRYADDFAEKVLLMNESLNLNEIALKLGRESESIRVHLKRKGIFLKHHKRRPHNFKGLVPQVVTQYLNGDSLLKLSITTGLSRGCLARQLQDQNIDIRNGSDANYIRMGFLDDIEKKELTTKANEASRGVKKPESTTLERAQKIERGDQSVRIGWGEHHLANALVKAGVHCVPQKAFDVFNIDIFVGNRIAVELTSKAGFTYLFKKREAAKVAKFIEAKVPFIFITNIRKGSMESIGDNLVREIQSILDDKNLIRQNWIIKCSRHTSTIHRNELGQLVSTPCPVRFSYRIVNYNEFKANFETRGELRYILK
jgi:hypothetical protein